MAKKQDADWTKKLPSHLRFTATGSAAGYGEADPIVDLDSVIDKSKLIEQPTNVVDFPEPLPEANLAPKTKGRRKKSSSDSAKEREHDVAQVKEILKVYAKRTHQCYWFRCHWSAAELQGNDLDLMTTKLACEYGIYIPESRVKAVVQYAAAVNSYRPIRSYLDKCVEL